MPDHPLPPPEPRYCWCGCGQVITWRRADCRYATEACRMRARRRTAESPSKGGSPAPGVLGHDEGVAGRRTPERPVKGRSRTHPENGTRIYLLADQVDAVLRWVQAAKAATGLPVRELETVEKINAARKRLERRTR